MNYADLINKAREAQERAYAPYSGFKVGAALLTKSGQVFTGANVENASYGLTVCAERVAFFQAVTAGEKEFSVLAITGSGKGYIIPCGACLQVMAEFTDDLKILRVDENNQYEENLLRDLLPQTFKCTGNSDRKVGC